MPGMWAMTYHMVAASTSVVVPLPDSESVFLEAIAVGRLDDHPSLVVVLPKVRSSPGNTLGKKLIKEAADAEAAKKP